MFTEKPRISKGVGIAGGAVIAVLALVLMVFFSAMGAKNRAISIEESAAASESQIQVVVQKRVDMLTQLVNAVQDSKEFERETLVELTQARAQAERGDIEASNVTLSAVAEAYPEIKSIELYDNLMMNTAVIENQLSNAREAYNREVREYNKLLRQFPSSTLIGMTNYEPVKFEMFTQNESADNFNPAENNLFGDN